jgi:hypothetical protein
MAKSMGHFRDSRVLSWLSGSCTNAPGEPPLKGPTLYHTRFYKSSSLPFNRYTEKFQKFNRKMVEIGKLDIPSTHIHDRSLS